MKAIQLTKNTDLLSDVSYYQLLDGRIWSIAEARFIPAAPEDAVLGPCPDEHGESSLDGLLGCLRFYGYDLGELKTDAEFAKEAREKRNALIAETDFMAMPDYPLDAEQKAAVMAYRQALRDVPEQAGFPRQIDWPVKP
jgi:hypothetical protein